MWAEWHGEIASYNAKRAEGFIQVADPNVPLVHFYRRRFDDADHDPEVGEKVTFLMFVDRVGGSRVASARRVKVVAGAPVPR